MWKIPHLLSHVAESHSSNMYIKLHKDGTLNMLRIYDNNHCLSIEISYWEKML